MGAKAPRAIELLALTATSCWLLLIADGNRLVALDVSVAAERPTSVTAVDLLPDQKLPLVRDLAFSPPTARPLWIVSGDNDKEPQAAGAAADATDGGAHPRRRPSPRPTRRQGPRRRKKNERLVSLWRTQSVPGAAAPLRVAVARQQLAR